MLDSFLLDDSKYNKKPGKDHPVKIPAGFNIFGSKIFAVVTPILLSTLFISAGSSAESQQRESLTVQDNTKHRITGICDPAPEDKSRDHDKILTVNASAGNLFSRPTAESTAVAELQEGDKVTLIRKVNEWCIVMLQDGLVGWAHEDRFRSIPGMQKGEKGSTCKEIKNIQFVKTKEGSEMVTILLGGNYPPETSSSYDANPMVYCDFEGIRLADNIPRLIKTGGRLIRQIRIGVYEGPELSGSKVRVVLDLAPRQDCEYDVRPFFFKDENLYSLIIEGRQE